MKINPELIMLFAIAVFKFAVISIVYITITEVCVTIRKCIAEYNTKFVQGSLFTI